MTKNTDILDDEIISEDNTSESEYGVNNDIDDNDNTEVEISEDYNIINNIGIIIDTKSTDDIKYITGLDRITKNILTNFEAVRIIGERIKQLTMGAKPLIKNYNGLNYEEITIAEFKLKMTPFKIIRPLPNGILMNYHKII